MNRSLYLLCAGAFLLYSSDASATQWTVGPGQTYTAPSQVAALVGDGDTVNIQAGTYPSDVTNWTANDLLLRGTGGHAQLASNGTAWGGKGIWVIQGDRTRVEWIEFGECSVPDHNGAGIRMEGKNLTVRHCVFRDNENGILAGTPASVPSNITIEHCEFDHNGYGDGFSHNLYINYTDTLFFRYNYSHHAHVGQELKSRAHVNFIEYNRLSNEATGDASREIDLPDGGQAYLIGNFIQQGPMGQNSNLVGFGAESLSNPGPHAIYAINNTMVNEKNVGSFFSMPATVSFKGYANIMAGGGTIMATGFPNATDTAGNLRAPDIADLNFQSAGTYDYRLFAPSPAQNMGIPAGYSTSGYPLVAWEEYVHPANSEGRCQQATLDAGAHQLCTTAVEERAASAAITLWPNPGRETVHITGANGSRVELLDALGRATGRIGTAGMIDLQGMAAGCYLVRVSTPKGNHFLRLVVE
ncbi:MAG: T9SS type A sorting domain-containing protein [Flavobacteriales bacterium]|nr:T9SS type A sorting domain-containing protein [Flavobacteriales bacterium]